MLSGFSCAPDGLLKSEGPNASHAGSYSHQVSKENNLWSMEQCKQGKSVKWICNLRKRITSKGWAWGSQSQTFWLSMDSSSCSHSESGSSQAGRRMDMERVLRGLFPRLQTVDSELGPIKLGGHEPTRNEVI
ncbi:hypothetical protein LR48_Vigan09g043500 [Vigna angularis]|uniref:Uncharacterized protein n=1 Tax=Phaseolus angularis TaxID=3914 RepID=A0A0L9V9L7_PHAAN|nr:hypothetical protein LR48_Vigan09g043500 [Vigna angularis]